MVWVEQDFQSGLKSKIHVQIVLKYFMESVFWGLSLATFRVFFIVTINFLASKNANFVIKNYLILHVGRTVYSLNGNLLSITMQIFAPC